MRLVNRPGYPVDVHPRSKMAGLPGSRAQRGPKPAVRGCHVGREQRGLFYNYFDTFPVAVVSESRLKEPRDVV